MVKMKKKVITMVNFMLAPFCHNLRTAAIIVCGGGERGSEIRRARSGRCGRRRNVEMRRPSDAGTWGPGPASVPTQVVRGLRAALQR